MNFKSTLFFILFSHVILAQDPYYINYSIEDGLPSSNIYSVFQEENGMIWFTTDVGIIKYNSKTFELSNTDNGLSDNEVFKMKLDAKGRIWMQTLNGKPCYIYKNKIYNNQNSNFLKKIKSNGMCINLYTAPNKSIYLTYRNGTIITIDKNNNINHHYIDNLSLGGSWLNDGNIYAAGSQFIYNISKNKEVKILPSNYSPRVFHLKDETLFSEKNVLYTTKNNSFKKIISLDENQEIINVVEEKKNDWWICTRNGLFHFKNGIISSSIFKEHIVSDILKDFEGNYWVTTLNKGVLFIPSLNIKQFLHDTKIKSLAVNKGDLWIGGERNNYYHKNNSSINGYNLNEDWKEDKISNIRFYNNKTYILGKSGFKIIEKSKNQNFKISINDILVQEDKYFIGTTFTAKLAINKLSNQSLATLHNNPILLKRTNILCEGKEKDIWIGTNFGLFKYNTKDSIVDFGKKNKTLDSSIEDLFFDNETNTLFVATASKGIIVIKNNFVIKKFNLKNGLNSNTCISIKKIKTNNYLIGSNNGLNLLDIKTDKLINFNSALGINNKRIKDIEVINNTTYLATDNGVLSFNLDYLQTKFVKPKCIINLLKNENGIIKEKINDYTKRDVSVSFNGISFIDKGEVQYYYKLENQDNKWSYTKETQVNYKSLPPNKYTFKVYCVNSFGIKSNIQKISFEITPPFWQKLWFKLIILSVLSLLSFLYIKIRFKKQQLRFEEEKLKIQIERDKANLEKQMIELEQKALRMQMNPHFIFNALNTIKGYYSEGNDEKAGDYISNFSMLLRMLLENTEPVISLSTEIKMLKLYIDLTKIRYKNSFQYQITITNDISKEETAIPTLLLQPIVENAIIHGLAPKKENGKLLISFSKKNNQLVCIVEDNGIGRNASLLKQKHKQHESKAIEITKERLALLEKENDQKSEFKIDDLYNEYNNAIGTKVTIKIPHKNIW